MITGDLNICESEEGRLNVWNQFFTEGDTEKTVLFHTKRPCSGTCRYTETDYSESSGQTHSELDVQTSRFLFNFETVRRLQTSKTFSRRPEERLFVTSCVKHRTAWAAKLLTAATALRAYRNRHLDTLMHCCETWDLSANALTNAPSSASIFRC